MHEAQLLHRIYARSAALDAAPGVVVGPGDDCAVIDGGAGTLLLTTDQLVEGRHFQPGTPPDAIARKAVARSLSDIAAMGGRPWVALASGLIPNAFQHPDELCNAIQQWGATLNAPVIGGDLASTDTPAAPLVLSVTVVGRPDPARGPVLRSTARPGDLVCVTGSIGASFQTGRHLTFAPRIEEGANLAATLGEHLHAMLDISDGLGRDAARIATASSVRIEIDLGRVPLLDADRPAADAIADGEDYELLFTVDPSAKLTGACPATNTPITVIGRVVSGQGCVGLSASSEPLDLTEAGWDHQ